MNLIYQSLDKFASKGKLSEEAVAKIKESGITTYTSIAEAVKDAQFIVEAAPKRMDIKNSTLAQISAACSPDAVISTNSSTMSITELSKAVEKPERFVGVHYFFPAVLMKLVEVIRGDATSDETTAFAKAYAEHAGKTVVVAQKDRPGFIANRIVAPVVVYNGRMADRDGFTPADIDLSMMKNGQKMGPMELADFTGVDVTSFCQDYYHEHLSPEYEPSTRQSSFLQITSYFRWPVYGRPVSDESLYTGKYNPDIPNFIQANEACKLLEEGVCSLEECDTAMELGYNMEGPIHYIQRFEPQQIADALNAVADHFGKEIFRSAATITTGAYKRG